MFCQSVKTPAPIGLAETVRGHQAENKKVDADNREGYQHSPFY